MSRLTRTDQHRLADLADAKDAWEALAIEATRDGDVRGATVYDLRCLACQSEINAILAGVGGDVKRARQLSERAQELRETASLIEAGELDP